MTRCGAALWAIAALLLLVGEARAEEKEPSALIELGGASEWGLRDGGASLGPAVAVEVTPLKDWLEIEAGVTSLLGNSHTEWGVDLLFKKPFTLSDTMEVEFGLGPDWMRTIGGGKVSDSLGGEAAIEFQFWPWPGRKFGWYLEPSYGYDFGRGHEQSIGITVGLLVAIP